MSGLKRCVKQLSSQISNQTGLRRGFYLSLWCLNSPGKCNAWRWNELTSITCMVYTPLMVRTLNLIGTPQNLPNVCHCPTRHAIFRKRSNSGLVQLLPFYELGLGFWMTSFPLVTSAPREKDFNRSRYPSGLSSSTVFSHIRTHVPWKYLIVLCVRSWVP